MSFTESLFDWFLSATLRGTLLTGAVLLIQSALRPWLPAFWRHALWLPVMLVLAAPMLPESSWSLEERLDSSFAFELATSPIVAAPLPMTAPVDLTDQNPRVEDRGVSTKQILAWAWLSGAILMFVSGLAAYARTSRRLARESVAAGGELQEEVAQAARVCGIRRVPRIRLCPSMSSPAVTGLLHPMLLLPSSFSEMFDKEERQLILLHELLHLRRGDLAINTGWLILQAIHWCNPVVWIAFSKVREDRELACDGAVLAVTSALDGARKIYGHALLKLSRGPLQPTWTLAFVGMFGQGNALRSRIHNIASYRRGHRLWAIPSLALILGLALAGGTRAQSSAEKLPGSATTTREISVQAQAASSASPSAAAKDNAAIPGSRVQNIAIEAQFIEIPAPLKLEIRANQIKSDQAKGQSVEAVQSPEDAANLVSQLSSTEGVDILSTPRVVTVSGSRAVVQVGQEIELEAGKPPKPIGISLAVLPTLKSEGIELQVDSTVTKMVDPATGQALKEVPQNKQVKFAENRITTKVIVQPGQQLVLGGLAAQPGKEQPERRLLVTIKPTLTGSLEEKLKEVVLPKVVFTEVGLSEAVAFFQEKARELDPDGPVLKILVSPRAEAQAKDAKITLNLIECPLQEALRYTSQLLGLSMRVEPYAVIFDAPPKPGS